MNAIAKISAAALAAAVLASPALAAAPQVGQPAPDFVGVDSQGQAHKLSALKGKTMILEWTNDGCFYVQKH